MDTPKKVASTSSVVITQLIAFFGCVVAPAAVTAVASVSYITFSPQDGGVSARVSKCLLFVIPYKIDSLSKVDSVVAKKTNARRFTKDEERRGHKGILAADGTLVISGEGREIWVSVSMVDIDKTAERSQAFLKQPTTDPLAMTVVASWSLSVIVGGLLTCLAAFYLVCVSIAISLAVLRALNPMQLAKSLGAPS